MIPLKIAMRLQEQLCNYVTNDLMHIYSNWLSTKQENYRVAQRKTRQKHALDPWREIREESRLNKSNYHLKPKTKGKLINNNILKLLFSLASLHLFTTLMTARPAIRVWTTCDCRRIVFVKSFPNFGFIFSDIMFLVHKDLSLYSRFVDYPVRQCFACWCEFVLGFIRCGAHGNSLMICCRAQSIVPCGARVVVHLFLFVWRKGFRILMFITIASRSYNNVLNLTTDGNKYDIQNNNNK